MKACGRVEVQLHLFGTSAQDGGVCLFHPPPTVSLPPEKESRHLLNRKLGGPQSRSVCYGEKKNRLPLQGIETIAYSL
jgi:hypothetical protein